ncbi:MAG: hypothetical protein GOVbin707_22 [Prokaryotic dsDNA virus sp.]|nr:MAG: hypothetical protein GOVbin707_22 [Prokaryotic dsDNA virus sp.]
MEYDNEYKLSEIAGDGKYAATDGGDSESDIRRENQCCGNSYSNCEYDDYVGIRPKMRSRKRNSVNANNCKCGGGKSLCQCKK